MQLTLRSLKETIRQELGRDPARSSAEDLVNEAGEAWVDAHEWGYLRSRSQSIDLVPGQEFYRLPVGVEDVEMRLERPNTVWQPILLYEYSAFHREKERFLSSVGREFEPLGTVLYHAEPDDEQPRLYVQLWPAQITETVVLRYQAGWLPLNESDDVADLPPPLTRSFVEWVRRYAMGREKQPQVNVDMMNQSFFSGPWGLRAMRKDGKASGRIASRQSRAGENYYNRKSVARGYRDVNWYDRYRWYSAESS